MNKTSLINTSEWSEIDNDEAIRASNRIISLEPTCSEAYFIRGNAFFKKGFYGPAIKDFKVTLKLDPSNSGAKKNLIEATELYNSILTELREKKEIKGFEIIKFLGAGWEGAVYIAKNSKNKKFILKAFYKHRIEKINNEIIGFYREPVSGCRDDLIRLSECLRINPCPTMYPFKLLMIDNQIEGVFYEYEKLINITRRYLDYSDVRLGVLKAFFDTQSYLLQFLELVMVDASMQHFMLTRNGKFRFVDYGESINPVTDFRCQEDHWEIVTLIKLLYQLFKPQKIGHFKKLSNFEMAADHENGLCDIAQHYPPIQEIIENIKNEFYTPFIDWQFYKKLAEDLPNKLGALTVAKINIHHSASKLKNW